MIHTAVSPQEVAFTLDRVRTAIEKQSRPISRELLNDLVEIAEELEANLLQDIASESVEERWVPLTARHMNGDWWRCPLAREILQRELTASENLRWGAKGMRDPENSMNWIRIMARGDIDEDNMPQAGRNFWESVRINYRRWKVQVGLGKVGLEVKGVRP